MERGEAVKTGTVANGSNSEPPFRAVQKATDVGVLVDDHCEEEGRREEHSEEDKCNDVSDHEGVHQVVGLSVGCAQLLQHVPARDQQ